MKRISSLLLICVMILLGAVANAEEFTLHNGTTFGMTPQEVIEIETAKGFTFEQTTPNGSGCLTTKGTVAGQIDTNIDYYFSDNGLYDMIYRFSDGQSFASIEQGLEKKYGPTEYTSSSGMVYPDFTVYEKEFPTDLTLGLYRENSLSRETRNSSEYTQRLLPLSDDAYVYIEHFVEHVSVEVLNPALGNDFDLTRHFVHYVFVEPNTYSSMEDSDIQMNTDL